jgi:hypothetical protein
LSLAEQFQQLEWVLANPQTLALVKAGREKVRAVLLEDDGVEEILKTVEKDEAFEEEEKVPAKCPRQNSKFYSASKKKKNASNKKNTLLEDEAMVSSKNPHDMLKKHEMQHVNALDKESSKKLVADYVQMSIFPNIKFAHTVHLHYSENKEGMTKEEKTGHLD